MSDLNNTNGSSLVLSFSMRIETGHRRIASGMADKEPTPVMVDVSAGRLVRVGVSVHKSLPVEIWDVDGDRREASGRVLIESAIVRDLRGDCAVCLYRMTGFYYRTVVVCDGVTYSSMFIDRVVDLPESAYADDRAFDACFGRSVIRKIQSVAMMAEAGGRDSWVGLTISDDGLRASLSYGASYGDMSDAIDVPMRMFSRLRGEWVFRPCDLISALSDWSGRFRPLNGAALFMGNYGERVLVAPIRQKSWHSDLPEWFKPMAPAHDFSGYCPLSEDSVSAYRDSLSLEGWVDVDTESGDLVIRVKRYADPVLVVAPGSSVRMADIRLLVRLALVPIASRSGLDLSVLFFYWGGLSVFGVESHEVPELFCARFVCLAGSGHIYCHYYGLSGISPPMDFRKYHCLWTFGDITVFPKNVFL